jgi:hypothetical protein
MAIDSRHRDVGEHGIEALAIADRECLFLAASRSYIITSLAE